MALTRDSIIGKKHPTAVEKIEAPGWGECYVRKLSAAEVERLEAMRRENDGEPKNVMARFVVLCAADCDGNRIFTDADAEELGREPWNTDAIKEIWNAGLKLNKMRSEDREDAKKNSENVPAE